MTPDDFLKSLAAVSYRIKRNNRWYEIRVREGNYDEPFVDKDGELFGVKNAKINFYVFNSGADIVADWAPALLNEIYTRSNWAELPEDKVEVSWEVSYARGFVEFLLNKGGFAVFYANGNKVKKFDPNAIY